MFGPTLLGLIVAMNMGCRDSGTVVLDGQPSPGDVGIDHPALQDTQVVTKDTQVVTKDTQVVTKDTQAVTKDTLVVITDTLAPDTAPAKDAVVASDGNTGFPGALDGIWLVGWIGGLNRFSWIRFSVTSMLGGTAIINQGALTGGTVPYWDCTGSTTWNITAKPDTIQLHFPSSLCTGMKSGTFTFTSITPFTGTYPKGAQFVAAIQALTSTPATISGYKFPSNQCDATMTSCKDPL